MTLFGREVVVQIGPPSNIREHRDLRVTFRAELTDGSAPNKGTVSLYNVARESVEAIQADGAVVRVLAGYDAPQLVFEGDPVPQGVRGPVQQGPDRLLTIEALDGLRAVQGGRVSISYATATPVSVVLNDCATALGVPLGVVDLGPAAKPYPLGLTFTGQASDLLDRITRSNDALWHIRDGVLYVYPRTGSTGEQAPLLSVKNKNVIGQPGRKERGRVQVKTLLDPSLRPGRPFRVESREVEGFFVAEHVLHEGDSWRGPYYSTVTGRPRD